MAKKTKISHWNYRVFKNSNYAGEDQYGIIEVYYDNKGKPSGYTDYHVPWGENIKDLKWELSSMLKACREPILTEEDFLKKRKKNVKSKMEK